MAGGTPFKGDGRKIEEKPPLLPQRIIISEEIRSSEKKGEKRGFNFPAG